MIIIRPYQTVILQIPATASTGDRLKIMVNADTLMLASAASCSTLRFSVYLFSSVQHAANQTEVSLATDQRQYAPPQVRSAVVRISRMICLPRIRRIQWSLHHVE